MNRPAHEALVLCDAPTAQQLRRLTMTGAASAKRRRKLRQLKRMPDSFLFVDQLDISDATDTVAGTGNVRHVVGARVSKLTDVDTATWEAHYYDTYRVERELGKWAVQSTHYEFAWQPDRTLVAERSVKVYGESHQYYHNNPGIDDMVDRFWLADDAASMWDARMQFEAVTADDCEDLITTLADYYEKLQL